MSTKSDRRKVLKAAEDQGWRIEHGSKHMKLFAPNGEDVVFASCTPSCKHAVNQMKRELRKHGVDV